MSEQKKRGRPPQHLSERETDTLDELEQQAKNRIKNQGRAALTGKLKLEYNEQEPGYHYFYATDSENYPISIQELLESGYEFVRCKHGPHRGEKIVQNSRSSNLYLMRVPDSIHQENMALQREKVDLVERQLNSVGHREYAGDSTELGKGQAVKGNLIESPLLQEE